MTLRIKQIEWANFLSYGDYSSFLNLDSLGPVLITGQRDDNKELSNGVGKSALCIAIVWCLFGRTPRKAAPGDKVVNWFTKNDCYVKIITSDGWIITRTRKFHGHDDLTIVKDGDDLTLSTNKNAQKLLKKLFNLDYDIFVSSMFFGQKTESFLEMSDIKRKATLERMLGLHRLNIWGDIAKEKKSASEAEQQTLKALVERKYVEIKKIEDQISYLNNKSVEFENLRNATITKLSNVIDELENRRKSIILPDLAILKTQLEAYRRDTKNYNDMLNELTQVTTKFSSVESEINQLKESIVRYETRLKLLAAIDVEQLQLEHLAADQIEKTRIMINKSLDTNTINRDNLINELNSVEVTLSDWNTKPDTMCPACRQSIASNHIATICEPLVIRIATLREQIEQLNELITDLQQKLNSLVVNRPNISVETACRDKNEIMTIKQNLRELAEKTLVRIAHKKELGRIKDQLDVTIAAYPPADNSIIELKIADAETIHKKNDDICRALEGYKTKLAEETNKHDLYDDLKEVSLKDLERVREELSIDLLNITKLDNKIKQYDYIRHSYHDRNKIKMFILSELIPYFNQRIEYYLNAFDCDLTLKFTSILSIDTSRWDYDFHSGGQQKRIDLAILFALYDLYILMYGQQCNVMVLDEVDGSLDTQGVKMFVDIITNDFAGDRSDKPDTIMIISHKNEMIDQFANQIMVTQDSTDFSHVQQS